MHAAFCKDVLVYAIVAVTWVVAEVSTPALSTAVSLNTYTPVTNPLTELLNAVGVAIVAVVGPETCDQNCCMIVLPAAGVAVPVNTFGLVDAVCVAAPAETVAGVLLMIEPSSLTHWSV
jgi:Na+(H+)/acetate symporter ActP